MNAQHLQLNDVELAEKLRRENCDQFNTLVRMHLSFILDQNTDEPETSEKPKLKKWNLLPFYKKPKAHNRGIMEGAPLTQEGICQIYQLIEYLKREPNISIEGVFRRTGSLSRQQELRALLNQGTVLSLEDGTFSVHDCASVLKGFLAELPEPLLTEAHYATYCQIVEFFAQLFKPAIEQRLLTILQLLLLLLPSENRVLLKDVLDLLQLASTYEPQNKMSADNLATLFTPHLLCPRKLSPENLHYDSQTLAPILSFMIKNSDKLFQVPTQLAVDIRTYFTKKLNKHKILSPQQQHLTQQTHQHYEMDESVSDNVAANTVFSFVDKERTAKENQSNPTETALAQLYAHIQSLPESSKKRKLVKQFNKENGHGTPLQVQRSQQHMKSKSISESIKKHIFQNKLLRHGGGGANGGGGGNGTPQLTHLISINEDVSAPKTRTKLFCTGCDVSSDTSADVKILDDNSDTPRGVRVVPPGTNDKQPLISNSYMTSTPAISLNQIKQTEFTPSDQSRTSMSPISCSAKRMCKAMQETMMTPRSRKPVLLISRTNICLAKVDNLDEEQQQQPECDVEKTETSVSEAEAETESYPVAKLITKKSKSTNDIPSGIMQKEKLRKCSSLYAIVNLDESITSTFREYLCTRSVYSPSGANDEDLSFSSRTDDYRSMDWKDLSEDKLSESLLYCLDGNDPDFSDSDSRNGSTVVTAGANGKGDSKTLDDTDFDDDEDDEEPAVGGKKYILDTELMLKPKQFNEQGEPIVFETSF